MGNFHEGEEWQDEYRRAKNEYLRALLVLLILVVGLYFGRSLLFAALVGGRPITRVELISELEKQGGQQALESLVTKELVKQEAQKKNINIHCSYRCLGFPN